MITKRFAGLLVKRPSLTIGLWGSPGIGKTFTTRQLLRETPCNNLSLHATTSPSNLALALARPPKLPAWAERTFEKLGSGEFVETSAIIDACGATLTGLAPFVLHLEDIHEVAPEQLEFIQNLARVVQRSKGIGLIVTSRTKPPEPFEAVPLQPISNQDTKRILEQEIGATLPVECLEWIQAKAAGNPLYTLQFFRFLARQGVVWNDGQRWHWRNPDRDLIPVTVEALIEQQLRGATTTQSLEDALGAKAMLPIGTDPHLWHTVSGLNIDVIESASIEFERRGLLVAGEFAHPLYREIQRQNLSAQQRQVFARRAIGALKDDHPEEATGFIKDAALEPEHALELLRCAADALLARGDVIRASEQLAQAVDYAPRNLQPALALEAARQTRHVNVPKAMRLAELASRDSGYRTEATHLIAELLAIQGHGQEAERALETLPDRTSRAWWQRLVRIRGLTHNDTGVLEVLHEHPEVLEEADPDTLARIARTLANHGQADHAAALVTRALETPELKIEGRIMLLKASSMIAYARSDFVGMEALERQVLQLAQGLGHLRWVDAAHFNRALALEALGDHAGQMQALEAAMQTCVELGDATALAIAQAAYGGALHASAAFDRAENLFLDAHAILSKLDVSVYLVDCESGLSQLYLDWQPPHGSLLAQKYAHAALEHAQILQIERSIVACACLVARVDAGSGHGPRALERTTQALEVARRLAMPAVLADALRAHGHALEATLHAPGAVLAWRESEAVSREINDLANAHLAGLEADRISDDAASARVRAAWFEERGLKNSAQMVDRYFPQLSRDESRPATLEVKGESRLDVLGPMQFLLQGQSQTVRGRKRQELLALLLEARVSGRNELGKLELLDALYPDSDEDQARSTLQETVRATRSSLGADVIVTTANGYALGAVASDAEEFLKSGDTKLWRGAYLDGLMLESRDDTVRESLHLALFTAATAALETDAREAARVGRILLDFDGYNLDFLELCVRALRATNNHKSLTRLYAEAQDRLLEVGEAIPERWQEFLERSSVKT
jgi:tetratricopeptide (TPR) repeat protein